MKIVCRHCDRYLLTANKSTVAEDLVCSNSKCKAHVNVKVLFALDATEDQLRHSFTAKETLPKEAK